MAGDPKENRRTREPRRPSGGLTRRARRIREEIVLLYRDLAASLDVSLDLPPDLSPDHSAPGRDPLSAFDLSLRLPLADEDEPGPDGEPVLAALAAELEALRRHEGTLRQGRAMCFQCRSSECEHAAPPDFRAVFVAYSATGKPTWREFTEACLAWGEPRIDLLYGDPPGLIAVTRDGRELTTELMEGFGRGERAYRLLGQVACGYLPITSSVPGPPERGALTLQVIGTRRGREGLRLHLNALGMQRPWAGRAGLSPDWWERHALRDAVRGARKDLGTLALRLDGRRGKGPIGRELRQGVGAVLGRLRGALERQHRNQPHRTRHVLARRLEGDRPTHTAFADAEHAPDDRVLFEPDRDTVIVLGPKGRVHVFAGDGRHVTSLHHRRESVDGKLDRKQWVPCDPGRRARFREAVERFRTGKPR